MNDEGEERPVIYVFLGLVIGAGVGWWIHQNRREIDSVIRPQQCSYHFPWSGQCSLPEHHAGEHR